MDNLIQKMDWNENTKNESELLVTREWLVTNGLGGYASGTVGGVPTRRYHGLLISALPTPYGRTVMLNHLSETFILPGGNQIDLGSEEVDENVLELRSSEYLTQFRLENGIPVWRYEAHGTIIEKIIIMPYRQNTVNIIYKLIKGEGPIRLEVRPSMHYRPHESPVNSQLGDPYKMIIVNNKYELYSNSEFPPLRFYLVNKNGAFTSDGGKTREVYYRLEAERGYESRGVLWNPGYFRAELQKDQSATLVASTEDWKTLLALTPEEAINSETERRRKLILAAPKEVQNGYGAKLVLAADQFIITPSGRIEDSARARASGDEIRTVIAGYHWFTDWGRDTMISLEGLTLSTGRFHEAGWILRTFAHYIKDGLIPNMFPEGENEGLYHTADATLWFFHALDRYIEVTNDRNTLLQILPKLKDVIEHHIKGTHYNIKMDPEDALIIQGKEGYQLTWMDAKVDGWVVTPRRGKAVEINALWYNALKLMEKWYAEEDDKQSAKKYKDIAEKVCNSFNKKFWMKEECYLYDVIEGEEGNDKVIRPNQIFAISLPHPVLEHQYWNDVLNIVKDKLLTPVGLRSLAAGFPDYKPKYFGDLRSRDAAYHQGTVWSWLIGPFIDAWLKVNPEDTKSARKFLEGFEAHLGEACMGSISEIFDAEFPYTPRGCIAQAWGVAETLRCYLKTSE